MAGLMSKEKSTAQYLDKLQVEKERGITIKAQTCSLVFNDNGKDYLLNLIDTPVSSQIIVPLINQSHYPRATLIFPSKSIDLCPHVKGPFCLLMPQKEFRPRQLPTLIKPC